MSGDAVGSEGDHNLRLNLADHVGDGDDGVLVGHQIGLAVGVSEDPEILDAELGQAVPELPLAELPEVGAVVVSGVRGALFAPRGGEDGHVAAGVGDAGHESG